MKPDRKAIEPDRKAMKPDRKATIDLVEGDSVQLVERNDARRDLLPEKAGGGE